MNEAYATGANAVQNGAAMQARPRASASAFRELTAKLRKTDVPSFTPVPSIQTPPPPVQAVPPPAPAPVYVEAPPAPVVPPTVAMPVPPPIDLPKPETAAAPVEFAPVVQVEYEQPIAAPKLDVIPEPVTAAPVEVVAQSEADPAPLDLSAALQVKEDAANEVLRGQAQSRQTRAELDLIWRMLLATPTADDRSSYLREAQEIAGVEAIEPLPPPLPEHDLSMIAPAEHVEVAPDADSTVVDEPQEIAVVLQADDPAAAESSELARSLLDMMASGASSGLPQERALAADTLLRLMPKLDLKSLVMLSQRVARMDNPPPLIVARLLREPRVEVSGPLLEDCPDITDKDLEAVIAEKDMPRLRMIARRRKLGPTITDALINSGDASVQLTLVRNAEAEMSQDGFKSLIAAAGSNIDLLAPLCTRADMSAPMAFELFWHAPAQLRRFILSRFLTDSETLTKILRITMSTNDDDKLGEQEVSLQHAVVEALERAARGRIEPAAKELGAALKIDAGTALRVLRDKQGEPLVVMLKTAGYPRQALLGLLNRFKDEEIGIIEADRELDDLVSIFETLSFNKARILLTYWDWSQRGTGPYAPID